MLGKNYQVLSPNLRLSMCHCVLYFLIVLLVLSYTLKVNRWCSKSRICKRKGNVTECFLYNMKMITFLNAFKIWGLLFYCPLFFFLPKLTLWSLQSHFRHLTRNKRRKSVLSLQKMSKESSILLLPFSPSCCLHFLFHIKSGPWETELCGAQILLLCSTVIPSTEITVLVWDSGCL